MRYNKIFKLSLIFGIGVLFYCYEFFLRLLTGAYHEQIINHFGITTHINFSFLVSSYNLTYALMQIPAGLIIDKYGSKKTLVVATIICGLGNIMFVSDGYILALIGRLIVGIGSSFAFIGVLKLSRENLSNTHFGLFASIVISLGTFAAAASQQISVLLGSYNISWVNVFIYAGLIALPLALLFYFCIPAPTEKYNQLMPKLIISDSILLIKNHLIWLNSIWAGLIYVPTVVLTAQYGVYYFHSLYIISDYGGTQLITRLLMGWVIASPLIVILFNNIKNKFLIVTVPILSMLLVLYLINFKPIITHKYLIHYVFLFGLCSSVQVLVWQFFNQICSIRLTGIGIAITNMIITIITELGQLISGGVLDLINGNHMLYRFFNISYNVQFLGILFFLFITAGYLILLIFVKLFSKSQMQDNFNL